MTALMRGTATQAGDLALALRVHGGKPAEAAAGSLGLVLFAFATVLQ
jgi:hypothetical protein